jgi:STE24 endopeptidase
MNQFLLIFAIFYVVEKIISFGLSWLNLRFITLHQKSVPDFFRETVSLEEYQKSIRYTRDQTRLQIVSSLIAIPLFWGMLLTGFWGQLDSWARSGGRGEILTGLIFLGSMYGIFYLISLPFNLYAIFRIEQRYGFNKMTLRLWLIDFGKGLLLIASLGSLVTSAVLWFMNQFADKPWWLYVWILLSAVQLFILSLYPVLIVPLFNKLSPLPAGNLRDRIINLSQQVRFPMKEIFVMDGSKRSAHSNAFFAGMGRFRRIILYDTLIQSLSEDELIAVLTHEIGHYKKKHTRTFLLINLGFSLVGLYVLAILIDSFWFYQAFGFLRASSHAALFIFVSSSGTFLFFIEPLFSWFSRRNEYAADWYAAQVLQNIHALSCALVKLTRNNLSNLTPHPLYSFFYYSHPTTVERISALERQYANRIEPSNPAKCSELK